MTFAPFRALTAALAVTLALPAFADTTIATAQGPETVAKPARLVVYDVAAIDTLDALGVEIVGTPDKLLVGYLDHVRANATPVGTLFEPDFEALANLNPDLIIAGGRSAAKVDALSRLAPTLDMTIPTTNLVASALTRLDDYGRLTGTEAKAAELHAALETKLAAARDAVAGKGTGLVILTNGPKMSAYGVGSRFGWIHDAVGLPEARAGLQASTHGEAISFEFIAEVNPDWLLVVDRGAAVGAEGESAQQTLDNALIHGTTAWTKGQVIYLDPAATYVAGGGVQALDATLDQLTTAFGASS